MDEGAAIFDKHTPPSPGPRGLNRAMTPEEWKDCAGRHLMWSVTEGGEVRLHQPAGYGRVAKTCVASSLKLAYLKHSGKK